MKVASTKGGEFFVVAILAALAYGAMNLWQYVRAIPDEKDVRTQPVPTPPMLTTLARGLACEALFPGLVERYGKPFTRWREYHRVPLLAARTGELRASVEQQVEEQKGRYAAANAEERKRIEFHCWAHSFDVHAQPVERAMEVLSNYEVCAEVMPGFDREHGGDFKSWKRRNEDAVDRITCCRQTGRSGQDYVRQLNTRRERELYRLANSGAEALEEQRSFCRYNVVRWLLSPS